MHGNDPLQQDSVDLVCNSTWTWAGCNEHGVDRREPQSSCRIMQDVSTCSRANQANAKELEFNY
jgi:hypothetical protein